jgi:hypothetical protein
MRKRKVWVEPLFGEGKQWHGLRRFRLRRLWRVNIEALLIGAGLNLKRLLQTWGWGRRLCPSGAVLAVTQPESVVFFLGMFVGVAEPSYDTGQEAHKASQQHSCLAMNSRDFFTTLHEYAKRSLRR